MPSATSRLKKILSLIFLLQLPFTIWPAFMSLLLGIPLAIYLNTQDRQANQHNDIDTRKEFMMNRWAAIAPVEPYHIPVLWSTEWQNQLGMMRVEHSDATISWGSPEGLEALPGVPSQWVYLPESTSDQLTMWDVAFDRLMQCHYVIPPAYDALFSFLDAARAPFLETVWHVRRPALVFFNIATPPQGSSSSDDKANWSREYRRTPQYPVSVHVAELPLPHHIPGHFLSHFEQMLLLTNGTIDPTTFPEWNFMNQTIARFFDRFYEAQSHSRILRTIDRIDTFLDDHLPFLNSKTLRRNFYTVTINGPLLLFSVQTHFIEPLWQRYTASRVGRLLMVALYPNPYENEGVDEEYFTVTSDPDVEAEMELLRRAMEPHIEV